MSGSASPLPPGRFHLFDPQAVPTPCLVIDRQRLEDNCRKLARLREEAGCTVLLALKAFALPAAADIVSRHLDGTAASGLYEAQLGRRHFGGQVHAFAPGLKEAELPAMVEAADHLIFNTPSQHARFRKALEATPGHDRLKLGLRINPRHREVENPLYDPAGPWSRLGVDGAALSAEDLAPFSFLHVHALCDHGLAPFRRMMAAVESRLGHLFGAVEEINLGGGILWTDDDFPLDEAIELLVDFRRRTGLKVTLEPGTAVALHAGAMVASVLDRAEADRPFLVTDLSATCHMPDVIEAPFTPECLGARSLPRDLDPVAAPSDAVRIGGPTCLAGDVIGTYRFDRAIPQPGDRLVFTDLAYYTTVKQTSFNGTPLPAIALWDPASGACEIAARFGYEDFARRLGVFGAGSGEAG